MSHDLELTVIKGTTKIAFIKESLKEWIGEIEDEKFNGSSTQLMNKKYIESYKYRCRVGFIAYVYRNNTIFNLST